MTQVSREQARQLIGKKVYAVRRDGTIIEGKLERCREIISICVRK